MFFFHFRPFWKFTSSNSVLKMEQKSEDENSHKIRIPLHIVFQLSIRFFWGLVWLPLLPLWKVHDQSANTSHTFLPALSQQSSFFFSKTGLSIAKVPTVRNLLYLFTEEIREGATLRSKYILGYKVRYAITFRSCQITL